MKILIPEIIQGLGSSFLAQRAFFAETVLGGQYKIQEARLKNSTDFAPELVQVLSKSNSAYGLSAGAVPAFP